MRNESRKSGSAIWLTKRLTTPGRDALQEILDELDGHRRDLRNELGNERVFWLNHSATHWSKNEHLLDGPDLANHRRLVSDAYLKTRELTQSERERYEAASDDDVNDPLWQALTEEETRQREDALTAVDQAWVALTDAKVVADQEWLERKQPRQRRR
jgi:hypothetical protein